MTSSQALVSLRAFAAECLHNAHGQDKGKLIMQIVSVLEESQAELAELRATVEALRKPMNGDTE